MNNDHYHVGDTLNADSINEEVKDKIYQEVVNSGQQTKWMGIENNVNMDSRTSKVITAAKLLKSTDPKTLEEKNKDSYMMIVDERGRLVFFSDKLQIGSVVEQNFINKLTDKEGSFTETINGQKMLVTYTKSAKSNWFLISLIPISSLMTGITSIGNNTMILLGLCLFIVILATGFISRKVVSPINMITGRFKEIEQGSMNMELMNGKIYKDEVGELIKWFNTFLINLVANRKMQEELRKAHDDLEKRVETRTSELAYLSLHDSLTDLNNRASFEQKMTELRKSNACNQSIIVIDVDGLKLVNDSLGHNQGDILLNNIAKMIKASMREEDFISRYEDMILR
jgi:methyl-accepting chemotaxis protein